MDELYSSLALAGVPGIGPRRFASMVLRFGSAATAYGASHRDLRVFWGQTHAAIADRVVDSRKDAGVTLRIERLLDKARTMGVWAVPLMSGSYPAGLRAIPDPPPVLWVLGHLETEEIRVAIVGTRRASPYGRKAAADLARDISSRGITVVSGLAQGIDSCAHQSVVIHHGKTVAVLGSAIDVEMRFSGSRLAAGIIDEGGALVSEYEPGCKAEPHHFPARNRVISGLSHAVIVVEAPRRSGALITAQFALEQGREVMAVPGSILSGSHCGCHDLIRDGATLVTCAGDVLDEIGVSTLPECSRARPQAECSCGDTMKEPAEAQVFAALASGPASFEDIMARAGCDQTIVGAALAMLEIRGLIKRSLPGVFERT